jgi:hypothetical protein
MAYMRQCLFKRQASDTSTVYQTAWIDDKQAKKGAKVSFKGSATIWEIEKLQARLPADQVRTLERSHTRTRPFSDI